MGWRPLPFGPRGAFLCMCSVLDLGNEEYVVSLSLICAGLSSSLLLPLSYLGASAHWGQIPAAQPGAHLSPASALLGVRGWSCSPFLSFPPKAHGGPVILPLSLTFTIYQPTLTFCLLRLSAAFLSPEKGLILWSEKKGSYLSMRFSPSAFWWWLHYILRPLELVLLSSRAQLLEFKNISF